MYWRFDELGRDWYLNMPIKSAVLVDTRSRKSLSEMNQKIEAS